MHKLQCFVECLFKLLIKPTYFSLYDGIYETVILVNRKWVGLTVNGSEIDGVIELLEATNGVSTEHVVNITCESYCDCV